MPTIDEAMSAAAARLRSAVGDETDVDASLRALLADGTRNDSAPQGRRRLWIAAAACAAAGLALGAAIVHDDSGTHRVSPGSTAAESATTTEPSAPRSTSPASTATSVPRVELDPATFELAMLPPASQRSDGAWWAFDGSALIRYGLDGTTDARVEVPGLTDASFVDVAPGGDVAYFLVPAGAVDPLDSLIAVALIGPRAGEEIARSEEAIDASGDTTLYPTARGLVADGDFGPDPRPRVGDPALPWLDIHGTPVEGYGQWVSYSSANRQIQIDTPILGAIYLTLPEGVPDRGVPAVESTMEGFLVATHDWAIDEHAIVLFGVGGPQLVELPESFEIYALYQGSLYVTDGTAIWRAPIPVFSVSFDQTTWMSERFPGPFESPEDALDTIVEVWAVDDSCDVPSRLVDSGVHTSGDSEATLTIVSLHGCDDSSGGMATTITLSMGTGGWIVEAAWSRSLCFRGTSEGVCV